MPLTVKRITREIDGGHLFIRDDAPLLVFVIIEFAVHRQAFARARGTDELDDGVVTDQRLAAPVHRDEREQPVFNLVPLAGPRRQVAHRDGQTQFIGQLL